MTFPRLIDVNEVGFTDKFCERCDGYGVGFDGLSKCLHCDGTGYKRQTMTRRKASEQRTEVDQ